jgi:XRE family aerobic/anaerobic benzoate catabolism transcriptional regulator
MAGNKEAMEDLNRILEGRSAFYSKADLAFNTSQYALDDCFPALRAQVRKELALPA